MPVLKPHLSLNVSNIEASVAFYERAFESSPAGCCVPAVGATAGAASQAAEQKGARGGCC